MKLAKSGVKHKTWAEIDLSALRRNYNAIKDHVGASAADVICVVKADAYGHGADRCALALYGCGARRFAVSSIEEAVSLWETFSAHGHEDASVLILGYTPPENAAILSGMNISQTVFSTEYADALSQAAVAAGCRVKVHFKLDTGMNRLGFDCSGDDGPYHAAEQILQVSSLPGIEPEGLFTHFACADGDDSITESQYGKYNTVEGILSASGLHLLRHVCNSAATLRRPDLHLDAVRAGIILYGLDPWTPYDDRIPLSPVMTFKSTISHIHRVRRGDRISYGWTYEAPRDILAATIPVGYADGFIRSFSPGGCVYINGKQAPLIGRVCMDQCMVDVTDIPARIGDEVVLFGGDREQINSLADTAHTINYELVCLIGKRVSRIYSE